MNWKSLPCIAILALAGCAGSNVGPNIARDARAYDVIPAPHGLAQPEDYRVGPLDVLDVTVFQEAEVSVKGLQVDASGYIVMPLIGRRPAVGKTAEELAETLAAALREKYFVNPHVTVSVVTAISQKVVVEGQVMNPGVFPLKGSMTLMEAIALAQGETRIASLKQVVVFRVINGQRMGALFDLEGIRRGDAADPQLLGNDVVVVGFSNPKALWRDTLQAAPLFAVFRPIVF